MKDLIEKTYEEFGLSKRVADLAAECEQEIGERFREIEAISLYNTAKVLKAFKEARISDTHFKATTGYGYDDIGREAIEKVYADIFKAEDALVRINFVNGTHSLSTALAGNLMPGDLLVSVTGAPYDTLAETIGIVPNDMSLMAMGVKYKQVELKDGYMDIEAIKDVIKNNKELRVYKIKTHIPTISVSNTIDNVALEIASVIFAASLKRDINSPVFLPLICGVDKSTT